MKLRTTVREFPAWSSALTVSVAGPSGSAVEPHTAGAPLPYWQVTATAPGWPSLASNAGLTGDFTRAPSAGELTVRFGSESSIRNVRSAGVVLPTTSTTLTRIR